MIYKVVNIADIRKSFNQKWLLRDVRVKFDIYPMIKYKKVERANLCIYIHTPNHATRIWLKLPFSGYVHKLFYKFSMEYRNQTVNDRNCNKLRHEEDFELFKGDLCRWSDVHAV